VAWILASPYGDGRPCRRARPRGSGSTTDTSPIDAGGQHAIGGERGAGCVHARQHIGEQVRRRKKRPMVDWDQHLRGHSGMDDFEG